jgi:hypothetical protein
MMTPKRNGQGAANNLAAETTHTTNDLDCATVERQSKRKSEFVTLLAKRGHFVQFVGDLEELADFTKEVGNA